VALAMAALPSVRADEPVNPMCEKVLPVALVQKVTGAKGVKLLPRNPRKGAGGDCAYGQDYDHLLFMVGLYLSGGDWAWKNYEGVVKGRDNVKLQGVGDVAYASGGTIVVARKGQNVVALSSFNGPKGIPTVVHMSTLIKNVFAEAEKMGMK
jgi:hypothetical protein